MFIGLIDTRATRCVYLCSRTIVASMFRNRVGAGSSPRETSSVITNHERDRGSHEIVVPTRLHAAHPMSMPPRRHPRQKRYLRSQTTIQRKNNVSTVRRYRPSNAERAEYESLNVHEPGFVNRYRSVAGRPSFTPKSILVHCCLILRFYPRVESAVLQRL